jgi:hypothetical protein
MEYGVVRLEKWCGKAVSSICRRRMFVRFGRFGKRDVLS